MIASSIDAVVFDAYGTLFDVHSVATLAEAVAPSNGAALSRLWRTKQLEYTWLQSLMQPARRDDFEAVTARSLDFAIEALALSIAETDRARLRDGYLRLSAYPGTADALEALAPRPRWILSNGTRRMLAPLLRHAALDTLIDGVLSVDDAGIYKPSPRVYALATARLALPPARIAFVSSNGWDAIGAKAFGFTTFWINRDGGPVDRHGPPPDFIVRSVTDVPALVAG